MDSGKLLQAAAACESAAAAETPEEEMRAVMQVFAHKETIKLALMAARHNRISPTAPIHERLPLRAEGDDFGEVIARIPNEEFFHLVMQPNFGLDGFYDRGGLKEFLKTRRGCQVKTISGKTTVGYTGRKTGRMPVPLRRRFHFSRGTLNLAT